MNGDDIMTMRLNAADGEIEWRVLRGGGIDMDDRGWDIVVGPDGHPVITGILSTLTDPANYRTEKLNSANGTTLWGKTIAGAINHIDREAGWLAACDNGDIIMVNRTWGPTTSYDIVLHKYAAVTGDTLWTRQYNSSGASADDPMHMRPDGAGNILVVGGKSGDYLVVKFDQADGSDLWTAVYDGPAGGYDTGAHIIEGPAGEVIATGFCTGSGTSWDVMTVAFDSADGAFLWEEGYDPGAGRADEGRALAVSEQGDLYVTGYCGMDSTGEDMLALHYTLPLSTNITLDRATTTSLPNGLRISAYPNPFVSEVMFALEIDQKEKARVAVYDVGGRQVSLLHEGALSPGSNLISWDGRSDWGSPIASGVYFVRIDCAHGNAVRKVTLYR